MKCDGFCKDKSVLLLEKLAISLGFDECDVWNGHLDFIKTNSFNEKDYYRISIDNENLTVYSYKDALDKILMHLSDCKLGKVHTLKAHRIYHYLDKSDELHFCFSMNDNAFDVWKFDLALEGIEL